MNDARFIPALTGARFMAAMMVLIGHGWSVLHFSDDHITPKILNPLPPVGMTLFFVLSGFVMWINYAVSFRLEAFGFAIRRFAAARFARLYPLYAATLLVGIIVTSWHDLRLALPDVLLYIPLLQAWVPGQGAQPLMLQIPQIGHAWSISVEMFLYLCFPAIALGLWLLKSSRLLLSAAILNTLLFAVGIWVYAQNLPQLVSALVPSLPLGPGNMWFGYYSPITRISEFVAGCCAGALYMRCSDKVGWPVAEHMAGYAAFALLVFGTALFSLDLGIPYAAVTMLLRALPVLAISYLLVFVSRRGSLIGRFLSLPWIVAGGEVSYSIYLVHPFVLGLFLKPEQEHLTLGGFAEWLAVITTSTLFVIVFACGTYTMIERPGRRWLRGKLMMGPAPIGAARMAEASGRSNLSETNALTRVDARTNRAPEPSVPNDNPIGTSDMEPRSAHA
jgi:peptidoglycan/LPS O-acetylase OafA/YrhL